MEKDFRAEIGALVQEAYPAMSDRIWGFAEPRFQEYDSSRLQQEYLKARSFSIRADLAGEETAFIAEYGSGKPVLAFLGEFDALSSLEQEADSTERRPVPGKTNGHGCGHHLLGTAAVAAADALKTYMESHGLLGTIRYYGCPAEENAGGKAYLVRDGFFNDCDAAITWHPSTTNIFHVSWDLFPRGRRAGAGALCSGRGGDHGHRRQLHERAHDRRGQSPRGHHQPGRHCSQCDPVGGPDPLCHPCAQGDPGEKAL